MHSVVCSVTCVLLCHTGMASRVPAAPQSRVPEEVPVQHEQQEQVVEGMVEGEKEGVV